ncbi:MAG: SGNH/GDSL hydrolase family protein [Planctomycetota bacterium]
MLPHHRDATWVFIGDSITDSGRHDDPASIGDGYFQLVRNYLLAKAPADLPNLINVGTSGNTVRHLADRWDDDVLAHKPDVLSVMIGINDVWRQIDKQDTPVYIEDYTRTYDELLAKVVSQNAAVRLVLCEPTVISPPAATNGNELLLPYVMTVRELAEKFAGNVSAVVPMHETCLAAERDRPDIAWWPDGVHPAEPGKMLLARTWLAATESL